ncbi:glycosyltransferase [Luteococcus peritonei]|uniref:Glycosyltransferase n=1 Tax=Luteococcus peritonei TaxID=88874 RepID=A0ABW4RVD9_9ACTN
MRIAAISYGTEGDVRPMLALGRELAARGHSMVLAGDAAGAPLAAQVGVDYVPLGGDLRQRIAGPGEMGDVVRRGALALSGIRPVRRLLDEHLHRWTLDLVEAASDADVVLSSGLSLPAGFTAAEALGLPVVATFFQPFAASRRAKSAMLPPAVPAPVQGPLFRLGNRVAWNAMRDTVNCSRSRLGLPSRRTVWRDYRQLGAWSPTLAPQPGEEVCVTGQWRLETGQDWQPDEALAAFLADGAAPVHIGFGSMAVPQRVLTEVVAGLDGHRAILAPGWSTTLPTDLPRSVHVVGPVPHDWLFPRVRAVVHHCGAGTSHTVVRAGVPSIPLPITADQPYWGDRLHRLGLGTRPVPAHRVTAAQVRSALGQVDDLAPAARQAAQQMAVEDGCGAAVAELERIVGQTPRS